MNTINVKGEKRTKDKTKVKLTLIFHKTGCARAKKVLDITGDFKDWDEKRQQFKANSSENEEKNKCLAEMKAKYKKIAEIWDQEERIWTPTQWSNCFDLEVEHKQNQMQIKSVSQTIDLIIEEFTNKKRIKNGVEVSSFSNVREYNFLKSSLNEFTRQRYNKQFQSFHFYNITQEFVSEYALFLQKRGKQKGNKGAVVHRLKKLRAVVNYASSILKMESANVGVFKIVESKMKHSKFIPKSIPHSVMKKIENLDRKQFSRIENFHIDIFLFSYFAGGMCNIDVAYLNWDSIKSDTIEYERTKVCREAKVPLIDKARAIIQKYEGTGYGNLVFPIFTHKHITEKQKRERLERLCTKVNQTLEKIRILVSYEDKITWNAARGSFITKMINDGYNPAVVAEHAGNSPQIIFKHYYKVMEQSKTKQKMNNTFK